MTIEIRVLKIDDLNVLDNVAPDVFDNPVDPIISAEFLLDSRHHLVVALDGNLVVGMASAVDYIHPDKPTALWINEVGVAPNYRRRGIGKQLIQALLTLGRDLGCQDAWLGTECDNTAAKGLYAAVGGQAEPFMMYTFKLGDNNSINKMVK